MMRIVVVLLATLGSAAGARAAITPGQIAKLPPWAAGAAKEAQTAPAPEDADAWVLLQRTELSYAGEGKVRVRSLRVVLVLGERGLGEADLAIGALAGKGSKLRRLNAWNARPDGEVEQLERGDALSVEGGQSRTHAIGFSRAVKGSVLAFESILETDHPMGPVDAFDVLEANPLREWSVDARSERPGIEVRLVPRHFSPWGLEPSGEPNRSVRLRDVPARPTDEGAQPDPRNALPWLYVAFQDPAVEPEAPSSATWNALAAWTAARYDALMGTRVTGASEGDPRAALERVHERLRREFTYRQMYLSPERGWIPLSPAETTRRRFGDCKDLTTWLVAEARAAGLAAAPALARIGEGVIEDDEPPSVFAFNHVIAAIRLEQSLGLPAEVETPEGRFLLVDATSRFVPLGRLDSGHAGRRVLICLPRGGVWVRVPDEAIVDDRFVVRLEGQVEDKGGYKGGLLLRAVGDAMGLRSADVEGGVEELRKRCYRLGLPPDAHCAVKTRSDPFDLGRDYEVVFEVQYSGALRDAGGGEFTLHVPGLAVSTESLVKAGRKRLQPVLVEGRSGREYDLDLRLARKLVPLLAKDRGDTPFRAYEFAAEATGTPEAPGVRVRFAESRRAAYFDFARREEGTAAWRKDRAQMRRLLEDGLTLRAAP